jgi:flap endonuclease-1
MGIQDLNKLIQRYAKSGIGRVPITQYSGKKIAIDGHNLLYRNMYGAKKQVSSRTNFAVDTVNEKDTHREWLRLCLKSCIKFLRHNVIPIMVFDGKHPPEKKDTQNKRREETRKQKENLDEKIRQLNETDILDRTPELIAEVQDKYSSILSINIDQIENLINVIDSIGLPWLQADGEAEQLCAMLAREGHVEAVFSRDTDNLALGCPVLLTQYSGTLYNNGRSVPAIEFYELKTILSELKLKYKEFLDMCIILGCDYNDRLYGMGVVTAYETIKEKRSLAAIAKERKIDVCNYDRCMHNFRKVDSKEIIVGGRMYIKEPNFFEVREILETHGISQLAQGLCSQMAENEKYAKEEHYLRKEEEKEQKENAPKKKKLIVRIKKKNVS